MKAKKVQKRQSLELSFQDWAHEDELCKSNGIANGN